MEGGTTRTCILLSRPDICLSNIHFMKNVILALRGNKENIGVLLLRPWKLLLSCYGLLAAVITEYNNE